MLTQNKCGWNVIASYVLMALVLICVLYRGLLAALFSGLLVYSLVHLTAPALGKKISSERAKMIAVAALSIFTVASLSLAIWGAVSFFQSDAGSVVVLFKKMADILEASRDQMPLWVREWLPESADALRETSTHWLREHAVEAKFIGQEAGRTVAHLLIGMIIGAMVALNDTTTHTYLLPLAVALRDRVTRLHLAFQQIVFAQVRIAAFNAVVTAIYLFIALPLAGIHLPLSKSMVAITFFVGLLPVVGNLMSNSVVVIVSLSHSLHTALISLLFLVVVHKLEYFLNARIIGSHINARAWELLVAMLAMESMFGLAGVVAAPVLYAYLKKELTELGLV
jgi:predicted PurR-regulated permease PerM